MRSLKNIMEEICMSTKTLGVIGGMGPQASASFYELIISNTKADTDQDHIDVLIYSHASIPDRTTAILHGQTEELIEKLIRDIHKMENFGVDYVVITCNTSHYFIEDLKQATKIPIISIIEETVKHLVEKKIQKVGLLATDGTIQTRIYTDKLEEAGIEVITPDTENQKKVMNIIYEQVKKGIAVDEQMFEDIVRELTEKKVGSVILGCTELSYYGSLKKLNGFYVNPQEILARECILRCGGILVERS